MSKFKVGDRVAVYDNGHRQVGVVGQIGDTTGSKNIRVDAVKSQLHSPWKFSWFHPKQCRRLIKRERRRVFIQEKDVPNNEQSDYPDVLVRPTRGTTYNLGRWVEFIEVVSKK